MSYGQIGVLRSIERYDPELGPCRRKPTFRARCRNSGHRCSAFLSAMAAGMVESLARATHHQGQSVLIRCHSFCVAGDSTYSREAKAPTDE